MKILVFLDYDMLIRHFILSGVFQQIERRHDVKYVFHTDPTSPKKGIHTDIEALGLKNFVRFDIPRKRMGRWDMLYCPTVLHNQRGTENYKSRLDIMRALRDPKWVRRYEILAKPLIFPIYRAVFKRMMGVHQALFEFVRDEAPDVVVHPSILQGFFINDLIPICKRLRIPFVCLMNSWDNPSQKAAATGMVDKLVVWGEQTRRHAIELMGMPPEDVLPFGAAQFEVYRRPVVESDAELRALFKVPAGVPLLLYGGTSKGVRENIHLERLERAIAGGDMPKCHVIYRPHPWRGGLMGGEQSFFDYGFRHITMDPHMESYYRRVEGGQAEGFDMADYDVTRKLLHLVDAVTSPLSTILLEAIMFQKPVQVILAVEHVGTEAAEVGKILQSVLHFSDLKGPGISYCHAIEDFVGGCAALLGQAGDPTIRASLKELANFFVDMDGPPYGESVLKLVEQLAEGSRSQPARAG